MAGGGTSRTNSSQTSNATSNVSTPGTAFGMDVLNSVDAGGMASNIQGQNPSWGAIPTTFVPQRTATDAPTQVEHTFVPSNYQPGIEAGLAAAGENTSAISPITSNLFSYWGNITGGGGQNPYLDPVIANLTSEFNQQADYTAGRRALSAGAEGAFGGYPQAQNEQRIAGQEADQFAHALTGLRYQDFLNTQGLINQAPGQVAATAGLNTLGADQTLQYGGLQQQNLQEAVAAGDYNAQVLQNNLHQAQALGDANAIAQAQDDIARWQAEFQVAQQPQENLTTQLEQLAQLLGLSRGVPGATTTSSGTATGSSTTRESQSPWELIATIISSAATAASQSDRRIKKNIEHRFTDARGVKWYDFHYTWDDDSAPKRYGVIAQELREIAPQFVHVSNGLLSVDYDALNAWES